ncbi:MAG TPA: ImmA/IrrE family metallo-endopeptidase [Longilinea sp.]|nr:ImmA/IrrE family metallo-endopeptidase [Longilinea sp.]
MTTLTITSEVFHWAKERAGLSDENLALNIHIKPEKIRAWEKGKEFPNFQQAQKLASALSIPLGYLFLSHPPEISTPIADFRTLPDKTSTVLSSNLQDVLDDALRKRDWYNEWRKQETLTTFEFVGKYTIQNKPADIIQDMRQVLDIPLNFTSRMTTWNEHLRAFIQKTETAGVLVLQSGIVGNNTRRKLSLEEFRGFTLADQFAPLVFINAQDTIAARIFTLAHELVHLWTGTSGISNPTLVPNVNEQAQIEKFCNKVAAEFLAPRDTLKQQWNLSLTTLENAQNLAQYFRVSAQVILRQSFNLGIIQTSEYFKVYQDILTAQRIPARGGGGNFYNSLLSRNSKRFTRTLISALTSGQLSYLDAARLLNTQPRNIVKVIDKLS